MSGNGHRLVSREGIPILLVMLLLSVAAYVFTGLGLALLFVGLFILGLYLFRDPICEVPAEPLAVISPASGKVISVCDVEDYWISRRAQRIRIKLSANDTHGLRSPIEGKVMNQWRATDPVGEFARHCAFWIQTDEADDLLLALGMGKASMFTRVSLVAGERTGQGQRCGFLYLSGVVDVYLPENARLVVEEGDKIKAGMTILGHFIRK